VEVKGPKTYLTPNISFHAILDTRSF